MSPWAATTASSTVKEQIEIVASLMEVPRDQARGVVLRMGQRKDVDRVTVTGRLVRLARLSRTPHVSFCRLAAPVGGGSLAANPAGGTYK